MATAITSHSGIQVELPVREGNKAKWDSFGVRWIGSFDGNPFLVRAELPSGWNLREKAATDFDKRSFTVLDNDGTPKADVDMKTAVWDKWAMVTVISNVEAVKKKIALAPKVGQEEFDSLLAKYNTEVRTTYGTGSRGQTYIDKAYAKLEAFVETHADFRSDLPTKHRCHDDGAQGLSGAMMTFAENSRDGDCSIM